MQGVTITLEELLALRHAANKLHLPQKKISSNSQQGSFQSSFRGRGMDFVETRAYQPGDDIRTINWAVTARTGKPHTKIYQQERDRPVYLIVDFAASMFFGTRIAFKSVIAAQVASLLAWAGLKQGDRVGGLLLKKDYQLLTPSRRKNNLLELFNHLVKRVAPEEPGPTDYAGAFRHLRKHIKSGSLIYFISDYYFLNEELGQELQQFAKLNEINHLFIYDPLEKEPPKKGCYLFRNRSKAESILVDTHSPSQRLQYSQIFLERQALLRKLCFNAGMRMVEIATSDDIPQILRQLLGRKS